jgi:uncharacterized membrane protein
VYHSLEMVWRPHVFRRALVAASVAWALALPLATFATSPAHLVPALYPLALAVYLSGAVVCHQIADRSFRLWSHQMPVCARCTGIYVGAAIAGVAALAPRRLQRSGNPSLEGIALHRRPSVDRIVLLVAALPTIATLAFEWTTGITPSNGLRALAGAPLGAATAWLLVRVLR